MTLDRFLHSEWLKYTYSTIDIYVLVDENFCNTKILEWSFKYSYMLTKEDNSKINSMLNNKSLDDLINSLQFISDKCQYNFEFKQINGHWVLDLNNSNYQNNNYDISIFYDDIDSLLQYDVVEFNICDYNKPTIFIKKY